MQDANVSFASQACFSTMLQTHGSTLALQARSQKITDKLTHWTNVCIQAHTQATESALTRASKLCAGPLHGIDVSKRYLTSLPICYPPDPVFEAQSCLCVLTIHKGHVVQVTLHSQGSYGSFGCTVGNS